MHHGAFPFLLSSQYSNAGYSSQMIILINWCLRKVIVLDVILVVDLSV